MRCWMQLSTAFGHDGSFRTSRTSTPSACSTLRLRLPAVAACRPTRFMMVPRRVCECEIRKLTRNFFLLDHCRHDTRALLPHQRAPYQAPRSRRHRHGRSRRRCRPPTLPWRLDGGGLGGHDCGAGAVVFRVRGGARGRADTVAHPHAGGEFGLLAVFWVPSCHGAAADSGGGSVDRLGGGGARLGARERRVEPSPTRRPWPGPPPTQRRHPPNAATEASPLTTLRRCPLSPPLRLPHCRHPRTAGARSGPHSSPPPPPQPGAPRPCPSAAP